MAERIALPVDIVVTSVKTVRRGAVRRSLSIKVACAGKARPRERESPPCQRACPPALGTPACFAANAPRPCRAWRGGNQKKLVRRKSLPDQPVACRPRAVSFL